MNNFTAVKKLPGVLAFQRGMVNTDARFYSEVKGQLVPLPVIRHGIRGTQNVNGGSSDKESAKSSAERNVANIQTTDSAKLHADADAMVVKFDLRMLPLDSTLFSCASSTATAIADMKTFRDGLNEFIGKAKNSDGLREVSRRYARNIANGRWLWRNRVIAEKVTISIRDDEDQVIATFDALTLSLNQFSNYSAEEQAVAEKIEAGLRGDARQTLRIEARVEFGVKGPVEVFPSQNYLEKKNAKGFARSLYALGKAEFDNGTQIREMGQAAIRDQKIGNALRTIDTWYPDYKEHGKAIPVEPNGANLDAMQFFRDKKTSSFTLFKSIGILDPNSEDGMFCIAALIRGGVYSESDKSTKDAKTETADDGEE